MAPDLKVGEQLGFLTPGWVQSGKQTGGGHRPQATRTTLCLGTTDDWKFRRSLSTGRDRVQTDTDRQTKLLPVSNREIGMGESGLHWYP